MPTRNSYFQLIEDEIQFRENPRSPRITHVKVSDLISEFINISSLPFNVKDYGASGNGLTDDTEAIQAAIDAAYLVGGTVFIPIGTFRISPNQLIVKSGISIVGEGRGSILKVIDNPGDYEYIFTSNPRTANVNNFRLASLTIDQNVAANTTCNVNVSDAGVMQFVFILWSGTNIVVENVYFDDCCGVNTVVVSGPQVANVKVHNCHFTFVKARTLNNPDEYDNSTIYLDGDGLDVSYNVFETTIDDRARGAIELHGKNATAIGNVSHNYKCIVRGVSFSGANPDPVTNNIIIANNIAYGANDGINLWSITNHTLKGVTITGNSIFLLNTSHAESVHLGISLTYSVLGDVDGSFSDVIISNNIIVAEKEIGRSYNSNDSCGISLQCTGAFQNIIVRNNIIRDFPSQGIRFYGRSTVSGVSIEGNFIIDCGNDTSAAVRICLYLNGTPKKSRIIGNSFIDTGSPTAYGATAIYSFLASGSEVIIKDNLLPFALPHLAITASGYESTTLVQAFGVSNGATLSVDLGAYEEFQYTCSTSAMNFTISNPYYFFSGRKVRFWIINTSNGALGTITWDTNYNLAGSWVQPASGKRRTIEFEYIGTKWYEVSRSVADIDN